MAATIKAFNAIHGTNLTESQGWSFMTLLKMKRSFTGDVFRDDDFVDEAAYTAVTYDLAMTVADAIAEIGLGLRLRSYVFDRYKTKSRDKDQSEPKTVTR